MTWVPGLCVLAGLAIGVPVTCVLSSWYDRRKNNDGEQPQREASNVTVLDTYRAGSNVRQLHRRWPA